MIHCVEQEIPPLINENDLHITQLAVKLVTLMLSTTITTTQRLWPSPNDERPNLTYDVLPSVFMIIQSSLLQGTFSFGN